MNNGELLAQIRQAIADTQAEIDKLWENPNANVDVDSADSLCRLFDKLKTLTA